MKSRDAVMDRIKHLERVLAHLQKRAKAGIGVGPAMAVLLHERQLTELLWVLGEENDTTEDTE